MNGIKHPYPAGRTGYKRLWQEDARWKIARLLHPASSFLFPSTFFPHPFTRRVEQEEQGCKCALQGDIATQALPSGMVRRHQPKTFGGRRYRAVFFPPPVDFKMAHLWWITKNHPRPTFTLTQASSSSKHLPETVFTLYCGPCWNSWVLVNITSMLCKMR